MEKIIQVGTKVTLLKTSKFYSENSLLANSCNPYGVHGVVINLAPFQLNLEVEWANGKRNYYSKDCLKILGQGVSFGSLYFMVGRYVNNAGIVGEDSGITLNGHSLCVGDVLLVKDLRETVGSKESEAVWCKDVEEGHYYLMGWSDWTINGEWNKSIEVSFHKPFYRVGYGEGWNEEYLKWCPDIARLQESLGD